MQPALRRSWLRLHRWVALALGWLLVLAGFLGALLTLARPLDQWSHPVLFRDPVAPAVIASPSLDAVRLQLDRSFGDRASYIVVQNYGRGSDFALMLGSQALAKAMAAGARVISLPRLQEASMRKIDAHNSSFWKAVNDKDGPDALGLLERQRVKSWLATAYAAFDTLPL